MFGKIDKYIGPVVALAIVALGIRELARDISAHYAVAHLISSVAIFIAGGLLLLHTLKLIPKDDDNDK